MFVSFAHTSYLSVFDNNVIVLKIVLLKSYKGMLRDNFLKRTWEKKFVGNLAKKTKSVKIYSLLTRRSTYKTKERGHTAILSRN